MQRDFRLESDKALLKPRNPRTIGRREDTIAKQWTKFVWMQKETKLKARNKNEVRFRVQWKWSVENGREGTEKSLLLPDDLPFLFFFFFSFPFFFSINYLITSVIFWTDEHSWIRATGTKEDGRLKVTRNGIQGGKKVEEIADLIRVPPLNLPTFRTRHFRVDLTSNDFYGSCTGGGRGNRKYNYVSWIVKKLC